MRNLDDEQKKAYCHDRGIVPDHHCCLEIAFHIAHPVYIDHQGRNRDLDWIASWNEYRIPVPYDGYSSIRILYCPWCGSRLPESKREIWFEKLYELGFSDPGEDDIPEVFESDRWWRRESL